MFVVLVLAYAITTLPSALATCGLVSGVTVAFYGWPDNSPSGSDNAFDCGHGQNADREPIAGNIQSLDMLLFHYISNDFKEQAD